MATPTNDSYTGASGQTLRVGRGGPAWLAGGSVGQWAQISDTAAPANLGAYSSIAVRDDETGVELFAALGGGHQYTIDDNAVRTLQLTDDAPAWVTRLAASDTTGLATDGTDAYYPSDGRPVCRHTYQAIHWVPELSAYVVGGCYWGSGGTTDTWPYLDVFVPSGSSGGDWSPLPTDFVSTPAAPGGLDSQMPSVRDPATGYFYSTVNDSSNRVWRWAPTTDVWSHVTQSGAPYLPAGANAWDVARGGIFSMAGGSWVTASGTLTATKYNVATGVKTAITLNSSAALTDLLALLDQTTYPGMDCDAGRDCFYWYAGRQGSLGSADATKVYRVIPNAGTTWDIELIDGSGGVTPPALGNTGVMTRFRYIPRWDVLILVVPSQDVYFMRLS